jgi:transcription-repair coupling factor (superfamily II helicase)
MYTRLLEESIRELKCEDLEDERRSSVNLGVEFRIEEDYIADTNQRLAIYRQVAQARTKAEVDRVVAEVRDRYGPLPHSVLQLAAYAAIRVAADQLKLDAIDREGQAIVFKIRDTSTLDPVKVLTVVDRRSDVRLVPPGNIRMELAPPVVAPSLAPGRPSARPPVAQGGNRGASWWTVRATSPAVTPGFSKSAVLKPLPEDPLAEGGLFERVSGLLSELSDSLQ